MGDGKEGWGDSRRLGEKMESISHPASSCLNPLVGVVPTNRSWMNTDPTVCAYGRLHMATQKCLRERLVCRSEVLCGVTGKGCEAGK